LRWIKRLRHNPDKVIRLFEFRLEIAMRAQQVMTRQVITVRPDTSIIEAANTMLQQHISGLPVVDDTGKLVGIVSEGDFIRRSELGTQRKRDRWLQFFVGPNKTAYDFVREQGRKVGEIMTPNPFTVTEDTSLDEVVRLMERKNVKRLPVMHEDRLAGIVTRTNLLQALASLARDVPDPTIDDDHIRDSIIASIRETDWGPLGLGIVVQNGIVQLSGIITNFDARQATIVVAENTPGVKEVHDHLCWVETSSGAYLNSPEDEELLNAG
jgi:CBS domain-containing protein